MDLSYLADLDTSAFEAERHRLVSDAIKKAAPRMHRKLIKLQLRLNKLRKEVPSQEFMKHCMAEASENLENISDLMGALQMKMGKKPVLSEASER